MSVREIAEQERRSQSIIDQVRRDELRILIRQYPTAAMEFLAMRGKKSVQDLYLIATGMDLEEDMTVVVIHGRKKLHAIRDFFQALTDPETLVEDDGVMHDAILEYPAYLGYSSSRRAFFIRSGASVYYWINERVVME